jgi:hypothetical protein
MSFGSLSSTTTEVPDPAIRFAYLWLDLIELLTDRGRERLAAQVKAWAEERGKAERAIVEIAKREQALSRREQAAKTREEALQKREADVADREQQAKFQMQRAEQAKAEVAELKADLRKAWAA